MTHLPLSIFIIYNQVCVGRLFTSKLKIESRPSSDAVLDETQLAMIENRRLLQDRGILSPSSPPPPMMVPSSPPPDDGL